MIRPTIRQQILWSTGIVLIGLIVSIAFSYPLASLQIIKLSQWSGLASILYLYLSLLISPFLLFFPRFSYRTKLISARRAVGVSGWGFALVHSVVSFFGQLGGIAGIPFLSSSYILAVIFGLIAFCIYSALALTSLDRMMGLMGKYWKPLHRLTYVATVLVVIHALMLGTHFRSFSQAIPIIFFFCLAVLVSAETVRFFSWLLKAPLTNSRLRTGLCCLTIISALIATPIQTGMINTLSVHPAHTNETMHISTTPHGNPRYTLIATPKKSVVAGISVETELEIVDFETTQPLSLDDATVHLIAVDDQLDWFSYSEPSKFKTGLRETLTFPRAGVYYLLAVIKAPGKPETTATATMLVSGKKEVKKYRAVELADQITMTSPEKISLGSLLTGKQRITFSSLQVIDPHPRLILLREGTLDFLQLTTTSLNNEISFAAPRGRVAIRTGRYRVFVHYSVNGTIATQNFSIELQ